MEWNSFILWRYLNLKQTKKKSDLSLHLIVQLKKKHLLQSFKGHEAMELFRIGNALANKVFW